MPAITLGEPYASLVVHRLKHVESRNWQTNRRGRFVVHARGSKPVDCPVAGRRHSWVIGRDGDQWLARFPWSGLTILLHPGHVLGTAELVDTRRSAQLSTAAGVIGWALEGDALGYPTGRTLIDPDEFDVVGDLMGADRVAWLLTNAQRAVRYCPACGGLGRLDTVTPCHVCKAVGYCQPIPAKGRQGWWRWKP